MGIRYFSEWLRNCNIQCLFEIPLQNFAGKRFAVDISILVFAVKAIAVKNVTYQTDLTQGPPDLAEIERITLDNVISRLIVYMQHGITPVIVFDSKAHPLKDFAKVKRKADKEKLKAKLKQAETNLYSVEQIYRNQHLVDEYLKYYTQVAEVSIDFMEQLKNILTTVGFPVYSASDFNLETTDSEGICAALCMQGNDYCVATVSNDSDYHAYGGNLEILDTYSRSNVYYVKVRALESILQQSKLSFDSFRDLCILMGSDFNPNLKGCGAVRSWNYITKYKSIYNMYTAGIDVSVLNYLNVFKIFASTMTKIDILPPDFNAEKFRECGRNTFDLYQLRDHANLIATSLDNVPTIQLSQLTITNDNTENTLLSKGKQEPIASVTNL
jgi:5'-3' exonuclease